MTAPIIPRSRIVQNLADLASQGRYNVDPAGAANMNRLFVAVAQLINDLEAEEKGADNDS